MSATPSLVRTAPGRAVERAPGTTTAFRRALSLVGVAAALAAFGLYLGYIARFGVDVPHWDDWSIVPLLAAFRHGSLHFSQLWVQHNEHRMLVPNLMALAVGDLTHFDVKVEMYLGAAFLAVFVIALIATVQRLSPRRWGDYAPFAIVMFMPAQWENALWGFQFAQFLVLALFATCVYALCRFRTVWGVVAAVALATAASFSSAQGLFVWPTAALLLWAGGRSRSSKALWFGAGALVWCAYFWNFRFDDTGGRGLSFVLGHPVPDVKFFLTALGGFTLGWGGLAVAQLLGVGMLLLGVAVLVRYARSDRTLIETVPAVLVVYALLFDLALVVGRSGHGSVPALESRYVTYNLLILLGAYITVLEAGDLRARSPRTSAYDLGRVLLVGVGALTAILVVVSATRAVSSGRTEAAQRVAAESVLVNYGASSDALVLEYLTFPAAGNAKQVRKSAPFLEQQHDSVFARRSVVAALRVDVRSGSTHELLPDRDLLPATGALASATAGSLRLQDAWAVLSTVYRERPDLRRAYPERSPDFDRNLVGWAIRYGATIDPDSSYLRPELSSFRELARIAGPATG